MKYRDFILYNLFGGLAWVGGFTGLGFFFGNLPRVKANFSLVVLVIIALSLLPVLIELIKARSASRPSL